jgi:hypothetical protein
MTESGAEEAQELFMSVLGYDVEFWRTKDASDPSKPPGSAVELKMSVKGASVEHLHNKPISRAVIWFTEGELETNRVGNLVADAEDRDIMLHARLPLADFAGFWAVLRLDRVARVHLVIQGIDVLQLRFLSEGSFFPLFPL